MKARSARSSPRSVGIWIRVSTEDQARGDSPDHHERRARAYAESQGWAVREIYHLEAVSGKSVKDHPEAVRMIRDITRGHISALIFSKLARLARNTRELLDFADQFRDLGADLISLQESIDTSSPAGRLFFTIIAAMAQWEREEITDRVRASIRVRAELGKNLGGAAPFGYRWVDNRLEIDPSEGPIRKWIYELFLEHRRIKTVVRVVNDAGYRTRKGAAFTDTTIDRLIRDPTAKGRYRSNHTFRDARGKLQTKPESEWVHTPVDALVSETLWEQCNEILRDRRSNGQAPGPKPVHLFAGLLRCGCGRKMYVFSRSPKYVCSQCRTKIPAEDLEAIFRERLKAFLVSEDAVREHLEHASEHVRDLESRVTAHERRLDRVREEKRKVYRLYQDDQISTEGFGSLNSPLEAQERTLASELPKLQGELDALKIHELSAEEVVGEAMNLHASWPRLSPEDKRGLIESIVESIEVSNQTVTITLCASPSSEALTKRQRNLLATLPCCYRVIRADRAAFLPVRVRGALVPTQPNTVGEFLIKRRAEKRLRQAQVAHLLKVSTVTLSRWECGKVFPAWVHQPAIAAFLGFDPFTDPAAGAPRSTKPHDVALLSTSETDGGGRLRAYRMHQRLTVKEFAEAVGVSDKTMIGWELGRRRPGHAMRKRLSAVIGFDPFNGGSSESGPPMDGIY